MQRPRLELAPGQMHRVALLILTIAAFAAALGLQSLSDRRLGQVQDAARQRAWQTSAPATGNLAIADVSSRFAIRASAGGELTWQVGNVGALLASLRALDATDSSLARVKVSRNGSAGFALTAEQTR